MRKSNNFFCDKAFHPKIATSLQVVVELWIQELQQLHDDWIK